MKGQKEKCTHCKRTAVGSFISTGGEVIHYCVKHKPKGK